MDKDARRLFFYPLNMWEVHMLYAIAKVVTHFLP